MFSFIKEPKLKIREYYRQLIPYLNEDKHRMIKVNAFCELLDRPPKEGSKNLEWTKMDWKNEYLIVCDG